jgi:DNA-directed RNA polymerase specialized sigma24 family protein
MIAEKREIDWLKLVNYVTNRVCMKMPSLPRDEVKSSALLAVVQAEDSLDCDKKHFLVQKAIQLVIDDLRASHHIPRCSTKVLSAQSEHLDSFPCLPEDSTFEILDGLDHQEKRAVKLRYRDRLNYSEIASRLGISIAMLVALFKRVKSRLIADRT